MRYSHFKIESKLKEIFPNFEIKVSQNFGIIKCQVNLQNLFACKIVTDVINKTDFQILYYFIEQIYTQFFENSINLEKIKQIRFFNERYNKK